MQCKNPLSIVCSLVCPHQKQCEGHCTLGIKGESLGNKLCVIGAGNVAMNVARTALRKGVKKVYIMYRGNIDGISAAKK